MSRPDHLALHVFEVDEDVDKDEVREITNTQYRFIVRTLDTEMSSLSLIHC